MHDDLHAVGAVVREQVRVVRLGSTDDVHDARERGLDAYAHVQP